MAIQNITPQTTIYLCWDVPLDNSYTDTLTFVNSTAQLDYFKKKTKYKLENLSPVGIDTFIRVPRPADELYDCNYIVIQNGNFSAKHLYAFITRIEYINVNVCNVYFEIDVMQTWQFNMIVGECTVIREHVNSDNIGEHTVPEPTHAIQFYKYLYSGSSGYFNPENFYIIVASNYSGTDNVIGDLKGGVFSGLKYFYFLPNEIDELNTFLSTMLELGKEDSIINIFMYPYEFYPSDNTAVEKVLKIQKSLYTSEIDGYIPKNNKMLCYPYNMLNIENGCGDERDLRLELYNTNGDGEIEYSIYGTISNNPCIIGIPKNYNGLTYDTKDILELSNFPMCSWSSDTYRAYVAQNATSLASNMVNTISKNPISGTINLTSTLAKNIIAPDFKTYGSYNGSNTKFASGLMDFRFRKKCISAEYAKIFDEDLTRYGYTVNRVKKPNVKGRAFWNYVKTQGANITGNIPFNDLTKIKSIFDNGITFWHSDAVGDYSKDNKIM